MFFSVLEAPPLSSTRRTLHASETLLVALKQDAVIGNLPGIDKLDATKLAAKLDDWQKELTLLFAVYGSGASSYSFKNRVLSDWELSKIRLCGGPSTRASLSLAEPVTVSSSF